jgi:DNA-binding transcriptional MerR regulator
MMRNPLQDNKSRQKQDIGLLPSIPDKRYFTIGEAGDLCRIKPHVLRYWEQEFSQLRPAKRRGNRRYYQYKDILIVRQIRKLLYEDGFTIEGARGQLSENVTEVTKSVAIDTTVKKIIIELENIVELLKISA